MLSETIGVRGRLEVEFNQLISNPEYPGKVAVTGRDGVAIRIGIAGRLYYLPAAFDIGLTL
jgi:hypothetical protein